MFKIYELVNISDSICFKCESDLAAAWAGLLAGEGVFGVKDIETGETVLPIFIAAGGEAVGSFFETKYGLKIQDEIPLEIWDEVASAYDSMLYSDGGDYEALASAYAALPDDAAKSLWRENHDRAKRTSIQQIVKRSWDAAVKVRVFADDLRAKEAGQ